MKLLDVDETRKILAGHSELRVSDIPASGLILENRYHLTANDEGEVKIFDLNPNDE